VAFDYRHFGASDGQPHQLLSVRRQLQDLDAALALVASHPAPWTPAGRCGEPTSAPATSSPQQATRARRRHAVPDRAGQAPRARLGRRTLARLAWPITSDLLRIATGRPRRYVHIAGRPGDLAFTVQP
jgi:uncharacterized protein